MYEEIHESLTSGNESCFTGDTLLADVNYDLPEVSEEIDYDFIENNIPDLEFMSQTSDQVSRLESSSHIEMFVF